MGWSEWFGRTPKVEDFARNLIRAGAENGEVGWAYDQEANTLHRGGNRINLTNFFIEFQRAPRSQRRALKEKYLALLSMETQTVPKLWTLAQRKIFPLVRSRYEVDTGGIGRRNSERGLGRASRSILGALEQVVGYDFGRTVNQVPTETVEIWGVSLDEVMNRALENLAGLPKPRWTPEGRGVWKLESEEGYQESFVQVPETFASLPARGYAIAMIPNRGVLLATGSEEPGGPAALIAAARESLLNAPWPLSSELLRPSDSGVVRETPPPDSTDALGSLQRLDIGGVYRDQKAALDAYHEETGQDLFVASYMMRAPKDNPDKVTSVCVWSAGVLSLLPVTDFIVFLNDPKDAASALRVPWEEARRILPGYFLETAENPQRFRVEKFPTPEELAALRAVALQQG